MTRKYSILLFFVMVITVPFLAYALVNWYETKTHNLPVYAPPGIEAPEYTLTDQKGNVVTQDSWKDKVVVANFFFTHCPVICPKMTRNLRLVQIAYPIRDLQITSFSVDPGRDSVKRLDSFARQFSIDGSNWKLLTGSKKEIYRLARKSFFLVATDGDGGPQDFIHSDKLVLLDKRGRIRGFYDGTSQSEVNNLINDIKKIKDEN